MYHSHNEIGTNDDSLLRVAVLLMKLSQKKTAGEAC